MSAFFKNEILTTVSDSNPMPVTDPTSLGTQGTGVSYDPPTGGSGLLGYLSAIASLKKTSTGMGYVVSTYDPRTNALEATIQGREFKAIVTSPAVAAKYSALQLWNPASSQFAYVIVTSFGFNSSGTMKWYPLTDAVALANITGVIVNQKSDGAASSFEVRTEALNARTSNPSLGVTVASITPNGIGLLMGNEYPLIMPGYGFRYEAETVNIAMNANLLVIEIPLARVSQ